MDQQVTNLVNMINAAVSQPKKTKDVPTIPTDPQVVALTGLILAEMQKAQAKQNTLAEVKPKEAELAPGLVLFRRKQLPTDDENMPLPERIEQIANKGARKWEKDVKAKAESKPVTKPDPGKWFFEDDNWKR